MNLRIDDGHRMVEVPSFVASPHVSHAPACISLARARYASDVVRLVNKGLTPLILDAEFILQGVRTKTVKKSARAIIEKYYSRLTMDFHTNKRVCDEVAIIPSKRMRNKIAGFVTHLMKRIQRGPVRGISLKLQEEERERRMDFVPEVYILCCVSYIVFCPVIRVS